MCAMDPRWSRIDGRAWQAWCEGRPRRVEPDGLRLEGREVSPERPMFPREGVCCPGAGKAAAPFSWRGWCPWNSVRSARLRARGTRQTHFALVWAKGAAGSGNAVVNVRGCRAIRPPLQRSFHLWRLYESRSISNLDLIVLRQVGEEVLDGGVAGFLEERAGASIESSSPGEIGFLRGRVITASLLGLPFSIWVREGDGEQ